MRGLFIICFLSATILFTSCTEYGEERIIYSSDFGFSESVDCTPAALRMIEAAKKHPGTKIYIERGTYHFYPDKAFEKYCFVTNHDDGLKSTPFPIIGLKDLEIEADSAAFIFHGLMVPVLIENAENIRISGFSIDWEIPLHSEVEVVGTDASNHTFDIRIDSLTPYEIRNGELVFIKEGYEHNMERAICWDPATMAVAYNTWEVTPLTVHEPALTRNLDAIGQRYEPDHLSREYRYRGVQHRLMAEELEPGRVRIAGNRKALPEVGHVIVAKGLNGYNRPAPAISVRGSKDITVENVTVHHAGGMGFVAERSKNITLDHFNVALKPGSGRMLTTTADATHFNNCSGKVKVTGCLFENMLDDATNIHGIYTRLEDILGEHTIGMRIGHFQQLGFEFAGPGDQIGFIEEGASFFPYFDAHVSSVERVNKRYYIIEFEESLPPSVKEGHLLENLDWYPECELTDNVVRNNRARGFLLNSPRKILCEGNTFSSMWQAISVHAGFAGNWHESGFGKEVVIRNNIFEDGCYGGGRACAIIEVEAADTDDPHVFSKIVIKNNDFLTFDPHIINVNRIDTLILSGNTVARSGNYKPMNPHMPAVKISHTDYIDFSGNVFREFGQEDVVIDEYSQPHLRSENNRFETGTQSGKSPGR